MAPDIGWLIAARALQGLGAASGMVIARAVVRDLYTGPDAAQLMATLMLVISVAPILAPLGGSAALAAGMTVIGFVGASHLPADHAERLSQLGVWQVMTHMAQLPALVSNWQQRQQASA